MPLKRLNFLKLKTTSFKNTSKKMTFVRAIKSLEAQMTRNEVDVTIYGKSILHEE